jgi:hypothetical protein
MAIPEGLAKPHRVIALLPVLAGFVLIVASLVLALTHLGAKGGAPQAATPTAQIAAGQAPHERSVYSASDYTEPNSK